MQILNEIDVKKQHIFAKTCLSKALWSLSVNPTFLPQVLWRSSLHVLSPYIVVLNSWFSFLWLFNDNVVSTIFILTIVTQFFFQPILQIDKSRTPKNFLVITSGKCKKIHLWWNFSRYHFILKGKMYKKRLIHRFFLTIYVVYID
jgi:hypothetical protein